MCFPCKPLSRVLDSEMTLFSIHWQSIYRNMKSLSHLITFMSIASPWGPFADTVLLTH